MQKETHAQQTVRNLIARREIGIGILGARAMDAEHAAAYADMPEVKVVGVFSRDPERARAVADICKAYRSLTRTN